jgi:hypothetical protein
MQQLTNAEEQLMEQLETGESFYERFTQTFPSQTKTTTVATLLKMMIKILWPILSLVTPEYYPLVKKPTISPNM